MINEYALEVMELGRRKVLSPIPELVPKFDMVINPRLLLACVGAFADPEFPQPTVSFYEHQRHFWVKGSESISRYVSGRNGG